MKAHIQVVTKAGKGRTFVILSENSNGTGLTRALFDRLSSDNKTFLIECSMISDTNWQEIAGLFRDLIECEGIRHASFIAVSSAASLVLHLALRELKLVRTVVLIDATTRPHPTLRDRIIDRIEEFLPLGLPLRSQGIGFDAKPFLQRIRCPVLIVTTPEAGHYARQQAQVFAAGLPTGWLRDLSPELGPSQLTEWVLDFQQVPAKCPQKEAANS